MTREQMMLRYEELALKRSQQAKEELDILRELAAADSYQSQEPEEIIPEMVTIKQAAGKTGLSYDSLRKLCLQDRIVYIKVGSKYLINMGKLVQFLNGEMTE